jgi:hypothetical protein
MDPLEIDPEQLAASSDAFTKIAQTAREISSALRNGISDLGDYAGDDPFGRAYQAEVGPGIDGITDALDGLGNGMDGTADGLKNSAASYHGADEANADSIHPTSLS